MVNRLADDKRKKAIGRSIEKIRKQKGLSQFHLAEALNCTQSIISQYEIGQAEPPLPVLIAICDKLGCSVDYLLGRNAMHDTSTLRGRLLKSFEVLRSESQETIVLMVEGVTGKL